jgi:hypothetical protein
MISHTSEFRASVTNVAFIRGPGAVGGGNVEPVLGVVPAFPTFDGGTGGSFALGGLSPVSNPDFPSGRDISAPVLGGVFPVHDCVAVVGIDEEERK